MVSPQHAFGAFAAQLRVESMDEPVHQRAINRMLDTIAVGISNSAEPYFDKLWGTYRHDRSSAQATVWGRSEAVSAPTAAFLNGCLAHGSDFDDTQGESGVHVSAVLVPATLAAAEIVGASGAQLIAALAAGVEISVRIGAEAPHLFGGRGFHATPVVGVYGAAAACAKLFGLDAAGITSAIAFSSSLSSGLYQFLIGGGDVKRLHAGWAAQAGLNAAMWARAGLIGPGGAFEGTYGLYRTFLDQDVDYDHLVADLGTEWRSKQVMVKRYPCCHFLHAAIDSVLDLRERSVDKVLESLTMVVPPEAVGVVCEPEAVKRGVSQPHSAKFSAYYVGASAYAGGKIDLDTFAADALRAPATLSLMPKITFASKRFGTGLTLSYPGGASARFTDGTEATVERIAPDEASDADIRLKFAACTGPFLKSPNETIRRIEGILNVPDVRPLLGAL